MPLTYADPITPQEAADMDYHDAFNEILNKPVGHAEKSTLIALLMLDKALKEPKKPSNVVQFPTKK